MFYAKEIEEAEKLESFIPNDEILDLLENTKEPDKKYVREIIQKSLNKNRLEPVEVATLLNVKDEDLLEEIFEGARTLKEKIYGNRIVLFAPLYVGNECINDCQYCGFRTSNSEIYRNSLTMETLEKEVESLVDKGHKRLIMVYGEHPKYDANFIAKTVEKVYTVKKDRGEIRRVNINAAPLNIEEFKTVKDAGIGTYQIFQETYHLETYKKVHPRGPKSSFNWRLYGLDRAIKAGIDDVGIGALFGLYDWKFEVMGLLYHTIHFENTFGFGPHTISFPRLEPAINTPIAERPPHLVSDEDFKKLVAIIRLAVPYTGLILTAREPLEIRNEVIKFGVSQIDAGSSIGIGSYSHDDLENYKKSQFVLGDQRSLDEVIKELTDHGFIPSFCTGCYRLGRTGEHFMEFSVPGFVKRFCTPNAVTTLMEYVVDYASPETKKSCEIQIQRELDAMPESEMKQQLLKYIDMVKDGVRDVYF
ncbi:[FeFe] hydrogenase H-cluster radical SAM maturase HydG [Tepiditoga spiralis]|uniref:[FeFe] hydrogenase H-cluster radical SAM maturase HydG n=1 Tax=Tepiditoga spiralis TaxID=2108365 RepID=A0A7G1G3A7_9BACT|nr:[FeFe] hydrogenase H-cluster radical SAM maturase HydG [Tepiditoga spiralis]BBE30841.1 [FeFe] hydrogenase H-cluster radical SAM maturase HydG [Tepiditoga spiralis]